MTDKDNNQPTALQRIFGMDSHSPAEAVDGVALVDELLIPRKLLADTDHSRKLVSESAPLARAWARFEANLTSHPDQDLPSITEAAHVARSLQKVRFHIEGLDPKLRPESIELDSDWVFGRQGKKQSVGSVEDAVDVSNDGAHSPAEPSPVIERDIYLAWSTDDGSLRIELAWAAPEARSLELRWQKWVGVFSREVEGNERLFDELRDRLQGNRLHAWFIPELYEAMGRFYPPGYPNIGDWPISHGLSLRNDAAGFYSVEFNDRPRLTIAILQKRFNIKEMPKSENKAAYLLMRIDQAVEAEKISRRDGKNVAPLELEG